LLDHGQFTAEDVHLKGEAVTGQPKSAAGRRTVTMPSALSEMLAEHMARRRLTAADADVLVFVGERGGPLNYSHWRQRRWVPACSRAGVGGLQFHDLRLANATGMVADGVDLKTAQTRLGHSDPRLTLAVYAQSTPAGDRNAADGLAARYLPSRAHARRTRDGSSSG
jgi:integrase